MQAHRNIAFFSGPSRTALVVLGVITGVTDCATTTEPFGPPDLGFPTAGSSGASVYRAGSTSSLGGAASTAPGSSGGLTTGDASGGEQGSGAAPSGCADGETECGSVCANLSSDAQNCGRCGQACATGNSCVQGQCAKVCASGTTDCGGSGCVDLNSDAANCGSCGRVCNATLKQTCVNRVCRCPVAGPIARRSVPTRKSIR